MHFSGADRVRSSSSNLNRNIKSTKSSQKIAKSNITFINTYISKYIHPIILDLYNKNQFIKVDNSREQKKVSPRNLSPSDINIDNQDLELITSKIRRVFDYYCQFGDRLNTCYIKPHKFQKFANDCELLDDNFTKIRLELIYTIENKHKNPMDFPTFLNSLVKIAEYKFEGDKTQQMNLLLANHILPLYSVIYEKSLDHSEMDINKSHYSHSVNYNKLNKDIIFDSDTQELLTIAVPVLFEIYKVYFPWEMSNAENDNFVKENTDRVYYNLLKDFDLSPALISRSFAFQIFQSEIVNNFEFSDIYYQIIKNLDVVSLRKYNTTNFLGKYFNFFNFIRMLCKISENGFSKVSKEFSQFGKFIYK